MYLNFHIALHDNRAEKEEETLSFFMEKEVAKLSFFAIVRVTNQTK